MADFNQRAPWKPIQITTKLPTGVSISSGSGSLAERPEHAQKIAYIISCWANIERSLCEIFAYTIENDPWIAADIISEVRKFQARVAIVLKHLRRRFGATFHDQANERFSLALDLSGERDTLAHGIFKVVSHYPDAVIRVKGWGDEEEWFLYEAETLDALFQQLINAANNVRNVFFAVAEQVQRQQYEEGRGTFPGQMLLGGIFHPPGLEPKDDEPQPQNSDAPDGNGKNQG